jgi:CDP-diacylglycerol--glycerol-3-phosphate 3-phosphatidyltransferase
MSGRLSEEEMGEQRARRRLHRSWWLLVGTFLAVFALFVVGLRQRWATAELWRWAALSGVVLAYELTFVQRRMDLNRRRSGELLSAWGIGNWVSLMRGLFIGLLAGFLAIPRPSGGTAWLPALLYTSADISDYLDGYLARRTGGETKLGEVLDIEWDALGLLVAVSLAVHYGILPPIYLPIGFARYLYSFAIALRRRLGLVVDPLPVSESRRPLAGLTMGFMSVMLWPIVPREGAVLAGTLFLIPFSAGFLRDGLVVTGVIDPSDARYLLIRSWIKRLFTSWLPLLARAALAWSLLPVIWGMLVEHQRYVHWYESMRFPMPGVIVVLFTVLEVVGLVLVLAGAAGRLAAFGLLFPVGFTIVGAGLDLRRAVALVSTVALLIFGTGICSLWTPAADLVRQRGRTSEGDA